MDAVFVAQPPLDLGLDGEGRQVRPVVRADHAQEQVQRAPVGRTEEGKGVGAVKDLGRLAGDRAAAVQKIESQT